MDSKMKGNIPPAGRQKSPYNRWLLLVAYTLQTLATGCVYFGWAPLSNLLLGAGVFAAKCPTDANGNYLVDRKKDGEAFICNYQDAAVQHLYAITLAAHFTTSAVAGFMMDTLGPKVTSILGQVFNIAGWTLISTLSSGSEAQVYAGFILIGMGADTAFLPTLLLSRLFPKSPGLVITLLGAACSASFVVPMLLWYLLPAGDLSGALWYVAFGPGLFLVVDAFVMPMRPFNSTAREIREEEKQHHTQQGDPAGEGDAFLSRTKSRTAETQSELKDLGLVKLASRKLSGCERCESIFCTIFSQRYLLLVVYFISVSWVSSFYQEAHSRLLTVGPERFLGWTLPLSFIPCIFLGKCADWIGILPVMIIVNAAGVLAYVFTFSLEPVPGYVSVLFFVVYMSVFSSQVFIFVEKYFEPRHFGRLVGLVELTGGLLSLSCSPVYASAVTSTDGNGMFRVQFFVIGLLLLEFLVLGRLVVLGKQSKFAAILEHRVPQLDEP